jgi:fructose-1,6-bisphosphatase/inositol monophosphatase family enzyme
LAVTGAPSAGELREMLSEACGIVRQTRKLIETALETGFTHRSKADGSFVTDVDIAVEEKARTLLASRFPEHCIIGEELPQIHSGHALTWVIDPIDGTKSFRHGVPLYGTLLALLHGEDPILGIIDLPGLGRTYSAARGLGTRCNGRPVTLEDLPGDEAMEKEIIGIGDRHQFVSAGRTKVFDGLMQAHPGVRTYTDCFGHALALEGSVGAMVDFDLRLWDTMASKVLMEEAGGRYVCFQRAGKELRERRFDVILGKPRVVDWILDRIAVDRHAGGEV